jgi:hypothetical protein
MHHRVVKTRENAPQRKQLSQRRQIRVIKTREVAPQRDITEPKKAPYM